MICKWADAPVVGKWSKKCYKIKTLLIYLMVIGSYRSDEVQEHHICAKMIRNLKMKAAAAAAAATSDDGGGGGGGFNMNEISVANLSLESVGTYINELLSISDPAKTMQLSSIFAIDGRSEKCLLHSSFLKFVTGFVPVTNSNTGSFQWVWEEGNIEAEAAATGQT